MDTRFLESFLRVVEEGSIAAAAKKLNLTPTAVAQRIRALEQEVGSSLLLRSGRNMQATEAGNAILESARELVQRTYDLKALATMDRIAGELRVGCVPTALSALVPDALMRLHEQYPQLRLQIDPGVSTELYRKLVAGELDVALMVRPTFDLSKELLWKDHRTEPFVVIAPSRVGQIDALRALRELPFIRYHRRSWGGMVAARYLQDAGIEVQERYELNTLEAIISLVSKGLGVSLVPDWRPLRPEGLDLVKLPLPPGGPARTIGLLWQRSSPRANLIRALARELEV